MTTKQELVPRRSTEVTQIQPEPQVFSFNEMERMAASLAKSNLFGFKDPAQILSLMMIAQAEGRHPATVARDYDYIQNRHAKKAEAMQRDSLAAGMKVQWHELTDLVCEATFSHPQGGTVKIRWDMERAQRAGLTNKDNWKKYPRAMLRSRTFSEGCRTVCPMATSGMYTPEEIRDIDFAEVPQTENAAIADATAAPATDEFQAMLNSMDVKTMPELEAAFAVAWKSTKDPKARAAFKGAYEDMKIELAEQSLKSAAVDEVPASE